MKIVLSAVLALFSAQSAPAAPPHVVKVNRGGSSANEAPAADPPAPSVRPAKRKGTSSRNIKTRKTGEGAKAADRAGAAEGSQINTVNAGEIKLDNNKADAAGAGLSVGTKDAPPTANPAGGDTGDTGGAGANGGPIEQKTAENGNVKKVEPKPNPSN